jgi:uncharacterized membrane protein/protein-disulfide isomerase
MSRAALPFAEPARAPGARWAAVCAAAGAVAALCLWGLARRGEVPGCGSAAGCGAVLFSRWSQAFGIPVAAWAAALYAGTAVLCLLRPPAAGPRQVRARRWALRTIAWTLVAAAGWFAILQATAVRQACVYCLLLHGWGLGLAWQLRRAAAIEEDSAAGPAPPVAWPWGVGCVAVLAAGQLVGEPPRTDRVTTYAYAGGRIALTSEEVPVLGDPQAKHVVLELFDYTCASCRSFAAQLAAAQQRYGDQLAILALPCPLEAACNPFLEPTADSRPEACAYARTAAAVWLGAPARFAEFHAWLLDGAAPPPLAAAEQRAQELLVGQSLEALRTDPRAERLLQRGIELYRGLGRGAMPKLLFGNRMQQGKPRTAADLFANLERHAGLQPPGEAPPASPRPSSPPD